MPGPGPPLAKADPSHIPRLLHELQEAGPLKEDVHGAIRSYWSILAPPFTNAETHLPASGRPPDDPVGTNTILFLYAKATEVQRDRWLSKALQ